VATHYISSELASKCVSNVESIPSDEVNVPEFIATRNYYGAFRVYRE